MTSTRSTAEDVELTSVQNGSATLPAIALEDDIMQCARLGAVALLQHMFDSGKYSAQYQDGEGITPLHVRFTVLLKTPKKRSVWHGNFV